MESIPYKRSYLTSSKAKDNNHGCYIVLCLKVGHLHGEFELGFSSGLAHCFLCINIVYILLQSNGRVHCDPFCYANIMEATKNEIVNTGNQN